jgi:hypothetical protein
MLKSYPNNIAFPQPKAVDKRPHSQSNDTLPPTQGLWRRLWAHRYLMHYHRLIALVVIVNLVYLWLGLESGNGRLSLATLSNFIITNFFVAIIIRQQIVINLLFKVATSVPTHWPLALRRVMGKVYHFGGLHVGGTVVGTIWFAVFVVSLTTRWLNGAAEASIGLIVVTYTLLAILLLMVSLSMPSFRAKYHNQFELMHRFGGWTALLLFWAQTILFTNSQSTNLWAAPSFWMLLLITLSIILPWLRLKKVTVKIENPSSHVALVKFNHGVTPFAGSSTAVSRSPLIEWHSFANVPSPHEEGFRLTISRAGDWTGQFIDDLPQKVWVKGIPTAGVGNIDKLFKRVVWIATGSGIGPTLPHLLAQEVPAHLVWSTRTPRETYGDALVDEILAVEPNALIWDTNESGRPDLVQLAYDAVQQFNAEAVIVIANKKLTWQVVTGMESRNIPAYGAIWDS